MNVTGPLNLTLTEGTQRATGIYRSVGVSLTAPKTNLFKGERTTLTVRVSGLQDIAHPVPLTLDSSGAIAMQGGSFQPLSIQPSQVGADGQYTTSRGISGIQAGGWSATATVVTQPFDIVLRDPDPPQTVLLNSFTGDYIFCGPSFGLKGMGRIKRTGCILELTDKAKGRDVKGAVNACTPVDNGLFSVFYAPGTTVDVKIAVTDTQPPAHKVYFNPLGRSAPPVVDTSAFATCP